MLDPDQLKQVTYAIADGIDAGFAKLPTLRDQFAMAALQGLLASETEDSALGALEDVSRNNRFERAAKFAYAHADAMLAAREPKTQPAEQDSAEKDPTNA